ncbi:MAG TPA: helix-turn-helix domain-containing protein [Anoxybacillus sp.]|jgi:transcriptional regulator with PAS, ATPase and Fis domain|nr:helix-turn-helix domain-containing protein [Anoxybacillus sp.]
MIKQALMKEKRAAAAQKLGIPYSTLYEKIPFVKVL